MDHASQVFNRNEKCGKGQGATTTSRMRQPSGTKSNLQFMKRAVSQPDGVLYQDTEQGQIRNQQKVKVETKLQDFDKVRSATACQDGPSSQVSDHNNIFIYSPLGNNNYIQPCQFQETKLVNDQKHIQQQQQQNQKDVAAFQQEGYQLSDYSKQKPLSQIAPRNHQAGVKGIQTIKKSTIKLPKVDNQEALHDKNQAQMLQDYQEYAQVHQQQLQFYKVIQTEDAAQNQQFEYESQLLNNTQQSHEKEPISSLPKASISQCRDLKQPADRSKSSQTNIVKSQSNRTLKLKRNQITRKQSEAVQDRQSQPKQTASVDKSTCQAREQEFLKQSTKHSKTSICLSTAAQQQYSTTCHEEVPNNRVLSKRSPSPHYTQNSQENIRDKALNCNYQQLNQYTENLNDHQTLFQNKKQLMFYPQHQIPRDYQTLPINPNEEDDELCNYEVNSQAPSNSFRNVLRDSHHIVIIDDKEDDEIPSSACESRIEEFHIN